MTTPAPAPALSENHDLAFFACGGTIDKVYFDAQSSYSVGDPAMAEVFARARANLPSLPSPLPQPVSLLKKDSLDMDDNDRALVAAAVGDCAAARVLITHGTDTMPNTARAIAAHLAAHPPAAAKTVVLTGAFLPAVFRDTDAEFNLGFALAAARLLPAGVYVAMNGCVYESATVQKDRAAGQFTD